VISLRNKLAPQTLVIGNGDVMSLSQAKEKAKKYRLDGIMIGRGIFENPWLFDKNVAIEQVSVKQRLALLIKHVRLYEKTWRGKKNFQILKKYFKIYVSSFSGAQDLRTKLMETNNAKEVEIILETYKV